MKKYQDYLVKQQEKFSMVIAMLFALIMLVSIFVNMLTPVDATELQHHYAQLEMIKQDVANIHLLEDARITIDETGMKVSLDGKKHILKAFFDNEDNFINATIVDNRIGSSLLASLGCTLLAFGAGYLASFFILFILFIPVVVYNVIRYIKKRIATKKNIKES